MPRLHTSLALVVMLCAAVPAGAQERTPTNPLDAPTRSPAPTVAPSPAGTPAPTAPTAAGQAPTALAAPTALPMPAALPPLAAAPAIEPPPIEDLLPTMLEDAAGMSEAEAVTRARRSAVAGRVATARSEAADSGVTAAELAFIPSVAFGARYTRLSDIEPGTIGAFNTPACLQDIVACQANPGAYQQQVVLQEPILDQYSLTASARWSLTDLIGAKRFDLAAAEADADAAHAAVAATELTVALSAVVTYWDVVRARAQAQLARESAAVAAEHVAQTESRRRQGLATDLEVLEARGNERGHARLIQLADNRVTTAEASFRHLLDLSPDVPVRLDARLHSAPPAPTRPLAALQSEAVAASPTIAAAEARAVAAAARADSREARLYPALTASFNLNYDNPNQRIFPQQERFIATWDASLALTWSLDGFIVGLPQVSQLRSLAAAERATVIEATQRVEAQVVTARGHLEAAVTGLESAHYSAGAGVLAADQMRDRQAAGLATQTQVMAAEAKSLSARLALVDALVDARVAEAQLKLTLGSDPGDLSPRAPEKASQKASQKNGEKR